MRVAVEEIDESHPQAQEMPAPAETSLEEMVAAPLSAESGLRVKQQLAELREADAAHQFAVYWLPAEYYRVRVLVGAVLVLVAAVPALYTTPVIGLLLAPSSAMAIYWMCDARRFEAGGDVRAFLNRPCALLYLTVCGAASVCIAAYDIVSLSLTLSSTTATATETAVASAADVDADAVHTRRHSYSYYILSLMINSMLLVCLLYLLIMLRKLRNVLE